MSQTPEPRRRGSIEWIPLASDRHKMIARPTLVALRAVLQEASPADPGPADGFVGPGGAYLISLGNYPGLDVVGGIVRVELPGRAPVGIARIGRSSYVAFERVRRLSEGPGPEYTLVELPLTLDETAGTLRLTPARGPTPAPH